MGISDSSNSKVILKMIVPEVKIFSPRVVHDFSKMCEEDEMSKRIVESLGEFIPFDSLFPRSTEDLKSMVKDGIPEVLKMTADPYNNNALVPDLNWANDLYEEIVLFYSKNYGEKDPLYALPIAMNLMVIFNKRLQIATNALCETEILEQLWSRFQGARITGSLKEEMNQFILDFNRDLEARRLPTFRNIMEHSMGINPIPSRGRRF